MPDNSITLADAARCARNGQTSALSRMLDERPALLQDRSESGDSLLGMACRAATGDIAIPPDPGTQDQHQAIGIIIAAGADVDAADESGWTPLHTAAMSGHIPLARQLMAAGASLEGHLYGTEGGSALALALFYAKTELGSVLAAPAVPDNLRHAAALGRSIDRFFDDQEPGDTAYTGLDFYRPLPVFPIWQRELSRQEILDESLTWAARNNQTDAMAALTERGADVNANPYRGTALLWAVYSDRVDAAAWLLDHGADPDLRHDFGGAEHGSLATAMHLAAQNEALQCLELLLSRGADPNIADAAFRSTPLGWAQHMGSQRSIELMHSHGVTG